MAMRPFCGYHMGDYFRHWLSMPGRTTAEKLPQIFYVNWFRKTPEGRWLWPGFGENSRVLRWIFERTEGQGKAVETPIGYLPTLDAVDRTGLNVSDADMEELLRVDKEAWLEEVESIRTHFRTFGGRLPAPLWAQLEGLEERLKRA